MHVRCPNCQKEILKETKWENWLILFSFFSLLHTQEDITDATYEHLTNCLMSFKEYAMEEGKGRR